MSAGLGALAPYHLELQRLVEAIVVEPQGPEALTVAAQHLDGRANSEFRRLVPLNTRRNEGTFFTGSELRTRALARYRSAIAAGVRVLDPACGFGDLLLAAAEHVPAWWTPERRVDHVRSHLIGRDINRPLVDVAVSRLALWAALAGDRRKVMVTQPSVSTADAFADDIPWDDFGLVLLNPPYAVEQVHEKARWATGSVTAAGPFTLEVLQRARRDARLAVILPDVLRSGSRYAKWRDEVEQLARVEHIDVVGQFDAWTDVDVFVAHLRRSSSRGRQQVTNWYESDNPAACLQEIASISVGDVVPHRHEFKGPDHPYLTVDSMAAWSTTLATPHRIRHSGRVHEPPFIALRRTSAPRRVPGTVRARGAVYAGTVAAAVENHLIVIKPKDGKLQTCMKLLEGFRSESASQWLDTRLRLRHLTVRALSEMPASALGVKADAL